MSDRMPKVDLKDLRSSDKEFIKRIQEENLKRVQHLQKVKRNNWITFGLCMATAIGIYGYTITAIKQETFLDDFEEPAKIIKK